MFVIFFPCVVVVRTTFNRPNLFYAVKQRFDDKDIAKYVKKYFSEVMLGKSMACDNVPSVLIYVNTQKDAERICKHVRDALFETNRSIVVAFYHAGKYSEFCFFDSWE